MPTQGKPTLGVVLREARGRLGASLDSVASDAGCSAAYVHKLEQDRVRSPSPRVLGGLAAALGLEYSLLMHSAGYQADDGAKPVAVAPQRFSNAHIVVLLEDIQREVRELHAAVRQLADAR